MTDDIIDIIEDEDEAPEIDDTLLAVMTSTINEIKDKIEHGEECTPRAAVVIGENIIVETYPGDSEDFFDAAEADIRAKDGVSCYVLCFDGFLEDGDGEELDAIIAEGAVAGDEAGSAVALLYTELDDGTVEFDEGIVYIDEAPNLLA